MIRSLVLKEIRQSSIVLVLGVIASVGCTIAYVNSCLHNSIPFVNPPTWGMGLFTVMPFALLLGIVQALEFDRRSSVFLLHMPISRRQLIWGKLSFGLIAVLTIVSVPALLACIGYSFPQMYPAPFYWSMTLPTWQGILSLSLVYLGGFLSGIRPARWFGTRLLPAIGAITLCFFVQLIPFWWILGLLALIAINACITETIFHVANTRDYA